MSKKLFFLFAMIVVANLNSRIDGYLQKKFDGILNQVPPFKVADIPAFLAKAKKIMDAVKMVGCDGVKVIKGLYIF